jgi:hypothetical protein
LLCCLTRWQHLHQLFSLCSILNHQSNQESASAGLELEVIGILFDDDGTAVVASGELEEFFKIGDLFRLLEEPEQGKEQ